MNYYRQFEHDVRNILASLVMTIELHTKTNPEEHEELHETTKKYVDKIQELIKNHRVRKEDTNPLGKDASNDS